MSSAIPKLCLTLLAAPSVEEKLLDVLLDAVGEEVFTSVPTSTDAVMLGGSTLPKSDTGPFNTTVLIGGSMTIT